MLHVLIAAAAVQATPMLEVGAEPARSCPVIESGAASDAPAVCGDAGPRIAVTEGARPTPRAERQPASYPVSLESSPRIRLETQAFYDGDRYVILSMDSTPDRAEEDMRRLAGAAGRVAAHIPSWKTEGY